MTEEDVEVTPVLRAAYFDQGISFAQSGVGDTILLAGEERWHTSPLQHAGALPSMPRGGHVSASFPDRLATSGPNEFAAVWRSARANLSPGESVDVHVGVYLADRVEPTPIVPPVPVALTASDSDRYLMDVKIVADAARRILIVSSRASCAMLRYTVEWLHQEQVRAHMEQVWRSDDLSALELLDDGSQHIYLHAPDFLILPQPSDGIDDLALVAAVNCGLSIAFVRLGPREGAENHTAGTTSISILCRLPIARFSTSPIRLWRSQLHGPLLLLSEEKSLLFFGVPPNVHANAPESAGESPPSLPALFSRIKLTEAGGIINTHIRRIYFFDVCSARDLCVTGGPGDWVHLWKLDGPGAVTRIARIHLGDGSDRFSLMGLAFVPNGPIGSFFACNSNGDDLTFPTLQYVQLGRHAALLMALLCLRRVAPDVYAASVVRGSSPSVADAGSDVATTRTPRSACILQMICEMAGLEPPGRCKCHFSSRCACYGNVHVPSPGPWAR